MHVVPAYRRADRHPTSQQLNCLLKCHNTHVPMHVLFTARSCSVRSHRAWRLPTDTPTDTTDRIGPTRRPVRTNARSMHVHMHVSPPAPAAFEATALGACLPTHRPSRPNRTDKTTPDQPASGLSTVRTNARNTKTHAPMHVPPFPSRLEQLSSAFFLPTRRPTETNESD
jgi:hypothetical protein